MPIDDSLIKGLDNNIIWAFCIFVVAYFFIATEKIDKCAAAMLGTAGILVSGVIPAEKHPYEALLSKVDLNVIFLLVGMMVIVNILARTGLFEWIAITIAQQSKGKGMAIFIKLAIATAILSAFLDNVTTVILIAPITILLAQILEIPAVPLLIMEALFSNIGGTATLIGDPPNVVVGSQAGLTFMEFLTNLGPCIAIVMAVSILVVYPIFRKRYAVPEVMRERVMKAHPELAIIDRKILNRALPIFILVILGFFFGRMIHVETGVVALLGALVMAVACRVHVDHVLEKVEWGTIVFFIGLFMLIGSLEVVGLFDFLGKEVLEVTKGNLLLTVMVILWASAIISMIVNNIPLVIALIPLIKVIIPGYALQLGYTDPAQIRTFIEEPLYWALALGACLGGNGLLIGASANIVIAQIATRNKYKLTFADFAKYGLPMTFLSLLICTVYMYVRYFPLPAHS